MPRDETPRFKIQRVRDPKRFDPRSFRTKKVDGHRVTVGCPRGQWDPERGRCSRPVQLQRILHPKSEPNPCATCDELRGKRGRPILGPIPFLFR